ncbi:MAG: hypothetical protein HKO93_02980 [Flavobacteriales bacterium]|nr:hypothetical protein [Flavobacteriales bacterium]
MHHLEPFYNWRNFYSSEDDPGSPFFERVYSEFEYSTKIYGYYIHPQWDSIGSSTLFVKVIFADYEKGSAVIEFIGEWNDVLHNDIMFLKRDLIDIMIGQGISKFVLIGENVMNFHYSEEDYYDEWFEEVNDGDGYIALLNFRPHVIQEMEDGNIDSYFLMGGRLNDISWRVQDPDALIDKIDSLVMKRLGSPI